MRKIVSVLLCLAFLFTCACMTAMTTYAVSREKEALHPTQNNGRTIVDWLDSPEELKAMTVNNKVDLSWSQVSDADRYRIYEKTATQWELIKDSQLSFANFYASDGWHTYGVSSISNVNTVDYYESYYITTITVYVFNGEDVPGKDDVVHDIYLSGTVDKEVTLDVYDNTFLHIVTDSFTWMFTPRGFSEPYNMNEIYYTSLGNDQYIKASKHIQDDQPWGLIHVITYSYNETIYNGERCYKMGGKRATLVLTLNYHSGNEPTSLFPEGFTGFAPYESGLFFVSDGKVVTNANGLINDPNNSANWYYCANGQVQQQYSGLAEYDGAWFYLENGKLNTTRVGIVEYNGGRFMIAAGRILREINGLIQDPSTGIWYFVAAGQVADYTGLALYDSAWFYVIDGRLATEYSGTVVYDGATFNVLGGQVV